MRSDVHEEIFDVVRKWWHAWAERDLETVEGMLDPDYTEHRETAIGPSAKGSTEVRLVIEEAARQSAGVSITDWEVYDPVTKLFEKTVVCSYAFRISGRRGRRSFTFVGRATDVLNRKEERWRFVSHHGTLDRT